MKKAKKNKLKNDKINITNIFCEYSHDYISLGSDIEETRNYFNFACIAWNLSLYQENELKNKLDKIVNEYEMLNPSLINSDKLKHDLETLIDRKLKDYSDIKRLITKITIEENGENYLVYTESTKFKL